MNQPSSFMNSLKPVYRAGQGIMGGAGAAAGIAIGSQFDNPFAGAAVGAAIGAATLPIGIQAAKTIGSAQVGAAKYMYNKGKGMASGMDMSRANVFEGANRAGHKIGSAIADKGPGLASKIAEPIKNYDGMFSKMYEFDMHADKNKFSLTGKGKAFLVGSAALGGMKEGIHTLEKSRLGTIDPEVHTMTPKVPGAGYHGQQMQESGINHAGATGDLAFALSNNRRG